MGSLGLKARGSGGLRAHWKRSWDDGMRRTGLSGDVGLMILWLFDGEDEDADELSEESEEDEEMPAISSCFRSACTRPGIHTALAPIPFPAACVDLTHTQANASFSRTRLLASTHPCIPTGLPSWNTSSLSHPYHLPTYAQLYDESNRSITHLAPHTCVYFSFFICFFLLTSGIQCYTRPTHHYCDNAGPFGNNTTGGGKTTLRAPGGVKAECSNPGATHMPLWRRGLNDELIVTLVDCIANWWVFSFRFGCIQPCFVYREFTPPAFFIGRFANVHLTCSISVHAKNPCARVTARGDEVACRRCFMFFKPPHALRMKQLGTA
jgi:hypothetical protein